MKKVTYLSHTAGVFIDESILETENDYCYLGTDHPFASAGTWAAYQVNNPLPEHGLEKVE